MGFFKVDINLLNQNYTPADWLADWLTDLLRHFDYQGIQETRTIEHLRPSRHWRHSGTQALGHSRYSRHSKGTWALGHSRNLETWALEALGHSKGTWALGHSRHLGTHRALGHSGTRALGHLGTWALRHLGTWSLGHLGTRHLYNRGI